MNIIDYIIVIIIAVCVVLACIAIKNKKGSCRGDCASCRGCERKDKDEGKRKF